MKVVNLLEFLNNVSDLYTLDYTVCDSKLVNFLDLMTEDEQFTQTIDLGIFYVNQTDFQKYIIVDGINRLLSLSLLLHAICECYKKTTPQNDKAIKTIRSKYLISGSHSKLKLPEKQNNLYNKIINGERLSGHEKETPMFVLLHSFWTQIKEEKLQASKIFKMLKKVKITLVETEDVPKRDLYYKLNSSFNLDQILLIDDYSKEVGVFEEWNALKKIYDFKEKDIALFFKDFFITKFNYKVFNQNRLYESFVNYFETMLQYFSKEKLISKLIEAAKLYHDILNVNFQNKTIKHAFIQIKKYSGEDTYAYLLDVYQDFTKQNISEETFLEILNTVSEYLKNRKINGNNTEFNELIQYLNAFITCK